MSHHRRTRPVHAFALAAGALMASVAGIASAGTDDTPDVTAARAGLAAYLDDTPDTGQNEPLDDCSLVDRATVNSALETAGVDAPLGQWGLQIGPIDIGGLSPNSRGITCIGANVGPDRDTSFPELRASLVVVDLGDSVEFEQLLADADADAGDPLPTPSIGGATRGACADIDLTDRCVEFWEQEGFVVGVILADRLFMDRPTASAVLTELVPAVVASLAGDSSGAGQALVDVTDEQVEAAADGLAEVIETLPEAPDSAAECPPIDRDEAVELLEAAGVAITFDALSGSRVLLFDDDGDDRVAALLCTGGTLDSLATFLVADFGSSELADEYVASLGLAEGGSPSDLPKGQVTVGYCTSVSAVRYCAEFWRRDGLVVGVTLYRESGAIPGEAGAAILAGIVPEVLANLAS